MKKIISILLSFTLSLSFLMTGAVEGYAQSNNSGILYVNPLLSSSSATLNDSTEALNVDQSISDTILYYSPKTASASYPELSDAADILRDKMVKRQSSITLEFVSSKSSSAVSNLFSEALSVENSVSSQDGDYLRWHIANAKYTQNSKKNYSTGKYLYNVTYNIEYITNQSQEEMVTAKLKEANKRLSLSDKSDYLKVVEIHDFICNTINYDYIHISDMNYYPQFSAYGGLFNKYAVCQSYATLFYRLCYENGIGCRVVTSEDHAWNLVNVYGKNYYIDCTWDDAMYDTPESNTGDYWSNRFGYNYFLYGTEDVSDYSHRLESNYKTAEFKEKYPISEKSIICPHEATENIVPDGLSCTDGFTAESRCRICKYPLGKYTIPANSQHSYSLKIIAPNCTEKGYTLHTCKSCNNSFKDEYTNAIGHSYKSTVTKATPTRNGSIVSKCSVCKRTGSSKVIYYPKTITMATIGVYNGKVKTPTVTIKDSKGKALTRGTDYTLTYASGRKNVGKYSVKITFKGNYSGTKTLYFKIIPKNTTFTLSAGKKSFTAKIKKYTTQTTGYQLQYATNSSFISPKTVNMKNTTTSKLISNLPNGKKYYVRVRTFKKVGSETYYSSWSKTKAIVTKK